MWFRNHTSELSPFKAKANSPIKRQTDSSASQKLLFFLPLFPKIKMMSHFVLCMDYFKKAAYVLRTLYNNNMQILFEPKDSVHVASNIFIYLLVNGWLVWQCNSNFYSWLHHTTSTSKSNWRSTGGYCSSTCTLQNADGCCKFGKESTFLFTIHNVAKI